MLERAQGSLIGLAVGDALGQPTEGWHPAQIEQRYGWIEGLIGETVHVSDDTEYTLFSAQALLKYGLNVTSDDIAREWLAHIVPKQGPFKGAGFSEMATIENLRRGLRPPASGHHYHAWSDGFAMRVAPFAIVWPGDAQAAAELAQRDGMVSHAGEGLYGGMAVAAAISAALAQGPLDAIVASALRVIPYQSWTAREIRRGVALGDATTSPREAITRLFEALAVTHYPWTDLAPEAVGLAFGVLAHGRGDIRRSLLLAVNLGRDADTVAAIVGAILGAQQGKEAIPAAWQAALGPAQGICLPSVAGLQLPDIAKELWTLGQQAS